MTNSLSGPKRVVLASSVGLAFGYSSVGVVSFGLFVLPLSQEFGWGRGDMSLALTLMSIAVVFLSPVAGALLDKRGVRSVLLPSILLFGLVIASLSLLSSHLWHYYAMYLLLALVGVSTTPASYSRVVVAWFDQHRGLALGFALAGIGVGTAVIPILVQALAESFGWRGAFLGLGGVIVLFSLPVVYAWVHEPKRSVVADVAAAPEYGYDFSASIRMRQFYLIIASFLFLGVVAGGILAHLVPLLSDKGVEPSVAAKVASLMGLALIVARLFTGYLLDRFFAPLIVAVFLSLQAVGALGLLMGLDGSAAIIAIMMIGLGIGAEMDFMSYLVSRYFGLKAFSRLYGLTYAAITVGVSIGPIVMGYSQQLSGNYQFGLQVLFVCATAAIFPLLVLGAYPNLPGSEVAQ